MHLRIPLQGAKQSNFRLNRNANGIGFDRETLLNNIEFVRCRVTHALPTATCKGGEKVWFVPVIVSPLALSRSLWNACHFLNFILMC